MWVPKQPDGVNENKTKQPFWSSAVFRFQCFDWRFAKPTVHFLPSCITAFSVLFCFVFPFFPSFPCRMPGIRQKPSLKYLLCWSKLRSPGLPQLLLKARKIAHTHKKLHLDGWCLKWAYWKVLKCGEILTDLVIQAVKTDMLKNTAI